LIYIQYFFGITYNEIFGIEKIAEPVVIDTSTPGRYGKSLISGPGGHWVTTGTLLVSYISVVFYYLFFKEREISNIKKLIIAFIYLNTIAILGARAPLLAFLFTTTYFLVFSKIKRKFFFSFILVAIILTYIQTSGYLNYLISSISLTGSANAELYRRIFVSIILFEGIFSVPLIGFGFIGRQHVSIGKLEFQDLMEVNIFLWETYDFGLIVGIITVIFYVASILTCVRAFKYNAHIGALSFIGILLCALSNGVQEYIFYFVPIIFLALSKWRLKIGNIEKKYYYSNQTRIQTNIL
jgi:hypothetical protein